MNLVWKLELLVLILILRKKNVSLSFMFYLHSWKVSISTNDFFIISLAIIMW